MTTNMWECIKLFAKQGALEEGKRNCRARLLQIAIHVHNNYVAVESFVMGCYLACQNVGGCMRSSSHM